MGPAKRELTSKKKAEQEEVVEPKKRKKKWRMPKMPENAPTFLYDTGIMLKTRGDMDLAIQAFDEALRLNPTRRVLGKILLARGECKAQIGQYFASLFGVTRAKRNDAWSSDCLYNEARIMYELCEYEDAMTKFYQGCLAYPGEKRFGEGVYQCRQTIQECIGDQAGPVLADMLRWIRIVEDQRQRILSGTSYGSAPGHEVDRRPISRTIIAAFVASGDISPGRVGGEEGVVLETKRGGSGTVLPDQEEVNVIRKDIDNRMTRHYLGRFTEDYKFLEKLVSATSRVDDTAPEQNYGFWSAQDPEAALMCPANRKGSYSMLSRVRDMLALIKSVRESLRCREPYHNLMVRTKSYVERDKRRELHRRQKMGEPPIDENEKRYHIPWAKLEQARQKAWQHLEVTREALMDGDYAKCLACGERARDIVEILPTQAFALGRKETINSGKSGYVRAIAREISRAYLLRKVLNPSLNEDGNRQKLLEFLGQMRRSVFSSVSNEMISESSFPFRDPYHLINRIEKWLKITSNEPKEVLARPVFADESASNPCEIYEHSGPRVYFHGPSCGGEMEKAWLFHEMGVCRLETGHIELAKRWARRAVTASRRALAEVVAANEDGEDEWGGTHESNQEGAASWLFNSLVLTARAEAMAGSIENAESAMINAAEELTKKLPDEKDVQEWIRFVLKSIKFLSRELAATKDRLKQGSVVKKNSLLQIAASTGISTKVLQHFLGAAWFSQKNQENIKDEK